MGPWLIIIPVIGIIIGAAGLGIIPNHPTDQKITPPSASVEVVKAPEISAIPTAQPSVSARPSLTPTATPTLKPSIVATPKPVIATPAPVANSYLSNNDTYINSVGNEVHSPAYAPSVPAGASAICGDGTYSFSQSRRGTCSHHGGVSQWL